jgi:hypothetical protein
MSKRVHAAGFALFIGISVAASANGCSSDEYVVGGECAVPLSPCGHTCVNLSNDPQNCGTCGGECATGVACVAAACGGSLDASSDATGDSTTDASPLDGPTDGTNEGSVGDGSSDGGNKDGTTNGDGGDGATNDGETNDGSVPDADAAPADGGDDGGDGEAGVTCLPPTSLCHGSCIDTTSDPSNCGACDNVCPAFLCSMSQCVSGYNGEVVLLGEDFTAPVPVNGSQQTVLTNTVFIRPFSPLRILAYDRYANANAVSQVSSIVTTHGTQTSQPVSYTETTNDTDIPTRLDVMSFDVLFVYDQAAAPTGTLGPLGTSWASTLATFLSHGGFIVVLDGAGGTVKEMGTFLTSSGLFNVTSQTGLANGTRVDNTAINDSVGRNVAFFGVTNDAAQFTLDPPSASVAYVFSNLVTSQPVIVHKTF